jgi:hypothetical protein
MAGIHNGVDKLLQRQHDEERIAILEWLTPIDYSPQHCDKLSRQQSGTGQWFLDSPEYQAWLETRNQTLFCPGILGAGKTILTSIVIDNLITMYESDETVGITYIYCDLQQRHVQTAEGLLRSLIKQLAQKLSFPPDCLGRLYDRQCRVKDKPIPFSDFSRALQDVASMYSRVFIVVDALDQCQTSHNCRSKFLSEIFSLQDKSGANFFATSLPIPDIEEHFNKCLTREIRASVEDIQKYLDAHMSQLPRCVSKQPGLQKKIRTEITGAVDGMQVFR